MFGAGQNRKSMLYCQVGNRRRDILSEPNRYSINATYKGDRGWSWEGAADGATWKDAIINWLEATSKSRNFSYQVISESPAEDGKSGVLELKQDTTLPDFVVPGHVRADLLEGVKSGC